MMVSKIRAPIPGHHFSGSMLNFGRVNDGSFLKKSAGIFSVQYVGDLNIGHFSHFTARFSRSFFSAISKTLKASKFHAKLSPVMARMREP